MSNSDLIFAFSGAVNCRKEKNIRLEYEKQYQQQMQIGNNVKTNM